MSETNAVETQGNDTPSSTPSFAERLDRARKIVQLLEQGDAIDGTPVQGYWVHAEEFPARADGIFAAQQRTSVLIPLISRFQ